MTNWIAGLASVTLTLALTACQGEPPKAGASEAVTPHSDIERKLAQYTTVRLTSDLAGAHRE